MKIKYCVTLIALIFCSPPLFARSENAAQSLKETVRAGVDAEYPELFEMYKDIHFHPELSFHEARTAQIIADQLQEMGYAVTTNFAVHGVVAILKNGPGPTLLLRAEMDALPVKEETGLPYASKVMTKDDSGKEVSVMHACGHDIHMTVFIGAARLLKQLSADWQGTLVLIAQPAEERGGGARAMIKAGLFSRFPLPEHCLALHVNATLEAGSVGLVEGFSTANVDSVEIKVRGVGGHGAYPAATKDPVLLAAQIVLALQTIVSREIVPGDPAVVTVGSIHGGTKGSIIPDEVVLQLTLRSYSDAVRQQTKAAIVRICRGQALAAGIPEDRMPIIEFSKDFTPVGYNDPAFTRRLATDFQNWFGTNRVVTTKPTMGGEDFALYGRTDEKIPICMFSLGSVSKEALEASKNSGKPLPSLHSSLYQPVPEPTIKTGVTAMVAAVLDLAGKQ